MVLAGLNVATMLSNRQYYPSLLFVTPPLLLVGFAGIVEPRLCRGVFHQLGGPPAPTWARLVGWTLWIVGLAIGGYVSFVALV